MSKNLLLAIGSILVVFLGVELFLRASGWPGWPDPGVSMRLCRYDATLGWRGKPGIHMAGFFYDDGPYTVDTNRGGWRDREIGTVKPPGITRIAVLGDSFTWGINVRVEKSYPRVLGDLLGAEYEVLSFGMPGYSTDQELIVLRSDALRFDPDIVILGLYLNDVYGNANISFGYPKPRFELGPSGRLALENVPVPDLRSRSRAVEFIKWHLYDIRARGLTPSEEYRKRHLFNVFYDGHRGSRDWKITEALLKELDRECRSRGIRFVVALIPFDFQLLNSEARLPQQILTEFGRSAGIPTIDLLPVFEQEGGAGLYFAKEMHWNEKGHAVAGKALARFLGERGFLPR